MGYTQSAIKGFSWLTALRVVIRCVSLGKTVVIARLLNPAQFGLFGIATIILSFIEVFTETGVNIVLVQQRGKIDQYLPTAWLVSISRGILITSAMVFSSPFVAKFFKTPEAVSLILVMSLVPFIRGFINPAVVNFQKELLFKTEFFFRTAILVIEVFATLILLYFSPQPISLVWGLTIGALAEMVLSFVMFPTRPNTRFNKIHFKLLVNQGKWITGGVILNFGFEKGDDIVVGRILGTQSLGVYDMAYRFSMLPITEIANMVIRVVFPVFVKISNDYDRLKRAYFKTIGLVVILVIPFGFILLLFTHIIVLVILGEKWLVVVPILKVLTILAVIRAVSLSVSSILFALEKQRYLTFFSLISVIGMLIIIVPCVNIYGIIGAAYAALIGYLISVPFVFYYSWISLKKLKDDA